MIERQVLELAIRRVYRRWVIRVVVRGLGLTATVTVLAVLVGAWTAELFRYSETALTIARVASLGAMAAAAHWTLIRPLRRRVSPARVALYLEEHEPSLGNAVLSAAELAQGAPGSAVSPALAERVVRAAVDRLSRVEYGSRVERVPLARATTVLAAAALGGIGLFGGSGSLSRAASALLPWSRATGSPYRVELLLRDTTIARGSDLRVSARLVNFSASEVELVLHRGEEPEWERTPMTLEEGSGYYTAFLLKIDQPITLFAEAAGVRSPVARIDVADLPYVKAIALEYRFPAYTGLAPQRVEGTGDIAALRGSMVVIEVTPTTPVTAGSIVRDGRDSFPLQPTSDGKLVGQLRADKEGYYRIVFESAAAGRVVGSPDYVIEVLEDQAPSARLAVPGRDLNVTAVEEVYLEAVAEDDYGVTRLELVYSVNGGAEQRTALYAGGGRREVSAGHTFFLEEWGLKPGDLVSYYARAFDARPAAQPAASDIYFLKVRPFDRAYRQAEEQPGAGAGSGEMNTALSERQREIVAATFNLVRDRSRYSADEFRENLATLALAQGKLREEVETLSQRIRSRGIVALDSTFREVAEALEAAVPEMLRAEELLGRREAADALGPEQRALQQLQRAEAAFREVQVARGQGGGAGGAAASAEELADLFDLELDKLRNQYERVERGRRSEARAELDAAMEKLRELAQRQQQENERLRAWADRSATASGDPRAGQRRLAQEAEELARQLERLARQESRPQLEQTARQLRQAAEAMRRAAAAGGDGLAQGRTALDRLRAARRMLEEQRGSALRASVDEALRQAEELREEQERVRAAVGELGEPVERSPERIRQLQERKASMASRLEDLERDLDRLATTIRTEQPEASRQLAAAASFIRDAKLREKILYSRGVIQSRSSDYARNFEEQIAADLQQLSDSVREARDAVGETREQRLARALEQTRDLVRGLESLGERLRSRQQNLPQRSPPMPGSEGGRLGERAEGARSQAAGGAPAQGGGFGGWLSPGEIRQFEREFARQLEESRELRELLRREGIDVGELDLLIGRLRALANPARYGDPRSLGALQDDVVQGLKEFEYAVRRMLEGPDRPAVLSGGSAEVPARYRRLVEEYFRTLSEQAGREPR